MFFDVDYVREETPGCEDLIHFNNAGASLMPKPVIHAVNNYFALEVKMGGYEAAEFEKEKIDRFYTSAGKIVNGKPSEIAYLENATRAWDMIFYSLKFEPGDKILTSHVEYASNFIAMMQIAKKTGAIIEVIGNDEDGQVSLAELERKIDSRTKLIAMTHIPTESGLVNPAAAIGEIAKKKGVFYLLDATQSVGQLPIDVNEIQCDALCATGRKYLRGPRGTGFLYINEKFIDKLEPPFLDLQAATWTSIDSYSIQKDAKRFETWERNYSNVLGLTAAIDYALSLDINVTWHRIRYLGELFRAKLQEIKGLVIRDLGDVKCGIVTFTLDPITPEEIKRKLQENKINVSVSLAEYARLDLDERLLKAVVRASVHYYNTVDEMDIFCNRLRELIKH